MIEVVDKKSCCGCAACTNACPVGCITMRADHEGFLRPTVDADRCIRCGRCLRACPVLMPDALPQPSDAYACKAADEALRDKSASGGVFGVLAEAVLDKGGAVFGAVMDASLRVTHAAARTQDELTPMHGSKYVQSETGFAFQQAKRLLEHGKPVLYSGTPCQIAGLRGFLGREYANLLTIGLVCRGVPTPAAFQACLRETEDEAGAPVVSFAFRDKADGWRNGRSAAVLRDGRVIRGDCAQEAFRKGFAYGLFNRPCCGVCRYKYPHGMSDITLGDCWGVEKLAPLLDDDRGVSVVLLHTRKGWEAFAAVKDRLRVCKISLERANAYNPCLTTPARAGRKRRRFFSEWKKATFCQAVARCARPCFWEKAGRYLLRLLRRLVRA